MIYNSITYKIIVQFKKTLIIIFSLSLISSSCSLKNNKSDTFQENSIRKKNSSSFIEENKTSQRGKVLCFERAQKEKNSYLSEIAYENCLLTIDENLRKFDKEKSDLYFLKKSKKDNKTSSKEKSHKKKKRKKKSQKKNIQTINRKKSNSCKEGTIAGGAIGAGIGLATSKDRDRFWAVPAAGTIGAVIGCQIDGG